MADRLPLYVPPDIDGPKVRLGVVWFAVSVGAAVVSQLALAVVLAVAAALAADQLVRLSPFWGPKRGTSGAIWDPERIDAVVEDPLRLPVVLAAGAAPLAAVAGPEMLAGASAFTVVLVLGYRLVTAAPGTALVGAAFVTAAAVPLGIAAAMPVLLAELGRGPVIVLLVLVAAYDAGDFLVGTGAPASWEGPLAGIVAVAACAFGAWVIAPEPIGARGVVALGIATAFLAPFGPPAASVLVGDATTPARFVRRLDTLLLVGPVAVWAATGVIAR